MMRVRDCRRPPAGAAALRVVFRVAANRRRSVDPLVRCLALADALGVRPLLSIRGGPHYRELALAMGADVLVGGSLRALRATAPDVVVVDDPIERFAHAAIAAARHGGARVVVLHDWTIGCCERALMSDGSQIRASHSNWPCTRLTGRRLALLFAAMARTGRQTLGGRWVLLARTGTGVLRARTPEAIARAIVKADGLASVPIGGRLAPRRRRSVSRWAWEDALRRPWTELADIEVAVAGSTLSSCAACASSAPASVLAVAVSPVRARTRVAALGPTTAARQPDTGASRGVSRPDDARRLARPCDQAASELWRAGDLGYESAR